MYYLRLLTAFIRLSAQEEMAYRANFFISLLHALLNLGTGALGMIVLFGQVKTIQGWNLTSSLVLLGVYLTLQALRGLFIGPSLETLAGVDGEVWTGRLDFIVLRPVNIQFLASLRYWRLFALIDLLLGAGVLGVAIAQLHQSLTFPDLLEFLIALIASTLILYAVLLFFAGLVFWSPGFLFTWVFNGLFQMARYPVGLYPGWARLVLTWIVPVGIMTTIPAEAISGRLPIAVLAGSVLLAVLLAIGASIVFQVGLRRYASASS
ncbi:MAG TPA: ABC-2 family transporter protein [Ktedonosporobacter sp.]|nr:ABC-2 family transporter protein [Ktedonosporobacter sp.]